MSPKIKLHLSSFTILRFLFYTGLIYFLASRRYFLNWSYVPESLFLGNGLTHLMQYTKWIIVHEQTFMVWKILLLLSSLGVGSKIIEFITFVLTSFFIMHAQAYGYHTHSFMPLWWINLFLVFSTHKSPQFIVARATFRSMICKHAESILMSKEELILMSRIAFCTFFFLAGVTKLMSSGFEWASSTNITNFILRAWVWHYDLSNANAIAEQVSIYLLGHSHILGFLATLALLLEIFCPLALFSNRIAMILIPSLFMMQQVIKYTLLVNFDLYLCIYIFWINWESVINGLQKVGKKIFYRRNDS